MRKILLLSSFFSVFISCSEQEIGSSSTEASQLEEKFSQNSEIVAFPFSGNVAQVYYGGVTTPVEIYGKETYVFEGDILLSPDLVTFEEVKVIYEKGETPPANKSVGKTLNRWTNSTVFYSIDPNLPDQHRVFDAIKHWEERTKLKFIERDV